MSPKRTGLSGRATIIGVVIAVLVIAIFSVVLLNYSDVRSISTSSSSTTSISNGVELRSTLNATAITTGERLLISISLFNPLSTINNVNASDDSWTVQGFPVAIWPSCTLSLPIEFTIINGNYSFEQLQAMNENYTHATPFACADSYSVQKIAFQPDSDQVNLTGIVGVNGGTSDRQLGSYTLAANFTVSGYWWYPVTAADQGDLDTPVPGGSTFQYPEISPTGSTPFVPGVYTLIVGDEWGQVSLTQFTVEG